MLFEYRRKALHKRDRRSSFRLRGISLDSISYSKLSFFGVALQHFLSIFEILTTVRPQGWTTHGEQISIRPKDAFRC